jgi:nitroreductase
MIFGRQQADEGIGAPADLRARAGRVKEGKIMVTRRQAGMGLLSSAALGAAPNALAQEAEAVKLPPPRTDGGKPLIQALKLRRSIREYADRALPQQALSDLLWAAFGINRSATGDRTAPYWRHVMVIDVYAAMADGVWLYEPKRHVLLPHLRADIRAQTGLQDFVGTAPLNLVYVAHGERMRDISAEERRLYASVDAGFIGQNVYLFCASEGLATVFRGAVDYQKLGNALKLGAGQFVTFAQTVGYPKT